MGPPGAKQINVHDSLDERCACEHFLGKTVEQAELLFRQNALYYEEDLLFMGPMGFRYYVPAFVRYIQSEHSSGDPDAINCFAGLLEHRSKKRREVASIAGELADACRYILQHYDRFGVDPSIYGDLRSRYESLVSRLHELHVG